MGRIIEGVWDCEYCGTKEVKGSVYVCPNCGKTRDSNVTFYMNNKHNYISEEKAKTINRNPDWLCSYCDSLNSDNNNLCKCCGATREDSKLNYFENQEKKKNKYKNTNTNYKNAYYQKQDASYKTNEESNYENEQPETTTFDYNKKNENGNIFDKIKSKFTKKSLIVALSILLTVVIGTVITFVCIPKTQTATIESLQWERSIEIEEYKTCSESDWSIPQGGRLTSQAQEIKSYEQVIDHYETKTRTYTEQVFDHYDVSTSYRDLGNGNFEEVQHQTPVYRTETKTENYQEPVYRQEPVYATKYYYDIERWKHKDTLKTSGTEKNPYWQEYECSEKEREAGRNEHYKLICVTENNKKITCELSQSQWETFNIGQKAKFKVYITGNAKLIE